MLVNETFVRHFLSWQNPIGATLSVVGRVDSMGDYPLGSKTIVGVVTDATYRDLRQPPAPMLYR